MLKLNRILLLIFILLAKSTIAQSLDTTLSIQEFEHLDTSKNPFLTQTDTIPYKCDLGNGFPWSFKCINEQFRRSQTPIHLAISLYGPDPTTNNKNACFFDSLVIVDMFKDSSYYLEEWDMRTFGYYKGKIIDQTSNYTLCLMLEGYSVGHEYTLISFTNNGKLISKIQVAGIWVGEFEIEGIINNKKSFKIKRMTLPVVDENTHTFKISDDEIQYGHIELSAYTIDEEGNFILVNSVTN